MLTTQHPSLMNGGKQKKKITSWLLLENLHTRARNQDSILFLLPLIKISFFFSREVRIRTRTSSNLLAQERTASIDQSADCKNSAV